MCGTTYSEVDLMKVEYLDHFKLELTFLENPSAGQQTFRLPPGDS